MLKLLLGAALALVTMDLVSRRVASRQISYDPVFGFVCAAGHTVRSVVEGHGSAHYVERGVRRRKPWVPAGPPPIVVLGDSFTEAHQVSDDDVYTDLLERMLTSDGVPNPVLNFAASGYSVADYVALAPAILEAFRPAWTVVQVRSDDFTTDAWRASERHFALDPVCNTLTVISPPNPHLQRPTPLKMALIRLQYGIPLVAFTRTRARLFAEGLRHEAPLFRAAKLVPEASTANMSGPHEYPVESELEMLKNAYGGRITILLVASYDPRHPSAIPPEEATIEQLARLSGL